MTTKKLLILGGYGSAGLPLARLLLEHSDANLILAGRSLNKAQEAARNLNHPFDNERVVAAYCDASKPETLVDPLRNADMLVVASSTAKYVEWVAGAAMEASIDYMDLQFSTHKFAYLQSISPEIEKAGLCFITDGGFHPGLPAAMVRFAALHFDALVSAQIGSVIKINWKALNLSPSTIDEFVAEFIDFKMLHYADGAWKKLPYLDMMRPKFMDFGEVFGRQHGVPMFLEEMRALPESYPSLQDTGFYVGGFNWFVDWFLFPLIIVAIKLFPRAGLRPMGRLMRWGLNLFSKPPYGAQLKLEAAGLKDGGERRMEMTISHDDGYILTAIPAAACLLQYLDGGLRTPGLQLQANIVEADRFIHDIERLGAGLDVKFR